MGLYNEIAKWAGWPTLMALILVAGGYAGWLLKNRIDTLKESNEKLERQLSQLEQRELGQSNTNGKPIKHYLLFKWHGESDWAKNDWEAAMPYIAKFQPACGFLRYEARHAEMVTIVGADSGVDTGAEKFLNAAGCKVERLDGKEAEHTKELLDRRVRANKAFEGGHFRLGY